MSSQDAQKRWELENNVQAVDPDLIYKYEEEKHEATVREKPWAKEYGDGFDITKFITMLTIIILVPSFSSTLKSRLLLCWKW